MGLQQTTEIAFLRAENDKLRRLMLQQHLALEWNTSMAVAFAMDLGAWLPSDMAVEFQKRMDAAREVAQQEANA